jgi:glycerophosphoryl diester phosphodiesterase
MKLIIVLSFLILGITSAWSAVGMGNNMKLIAHRGASDLAPENTLESTLLSFDQGAAGAECDVQLTKDGEVILLHDDTLQRTTGVNKKPSELTWAEIKDLDAGSWFDKDHSNKSNKKWSSVRIPRLEDIFISLLKHPGKIIVVELKENNPNLPSKVAALIKKLDKKGRLLKQIYFISFHHQLLDEMKKLTPKIPAFY